ncbi:MAG: CPBP family intramembrane metalloprotease [Desulfobacterales bacterium]|nr:CPBP family intramembrane metalloprotease [Desulfobacterales bacterium]
MNKIKLSTFFISISLVALTELLLPVIFKHLSNLTIVGIIRIVQINLILIVVFAFNSNLKAIGFSQDTLFSGLRQGIIWSIGFGIIAIFGLIIIFLFLKMNPFGLIRIYMPNDKIGIILFFAVGGIIAPIAEEIFFRGIIYGFLRQFGIIFAILFTTLIFAFAHGNFSIIPVIQIAGGLIFAVSYEVEKKLLVPIIIHSLGNISLAIISMFTVGIKG